MLLLCDPTDMERIAPRVAGELPGSTFTLVLTPKEAREALTERPFDLVVEHRAIGRAAALVGAVHLDLGRPSVPWLVLVENSTGELALWAVEQKSRWQQHTDQTTLGDALRAALHTGTGDVPEAGGQVVRHLYDALEASTCAVNSRGTIVIYNKAWRVFSAANGGAVSELSDRTNYFDVCGAVEVGSSLDHGDAEKVAEGLRQVLAGETLRFEHDYPCHSPQEQRWFSVRITPCEVERSSGAAITHVDVTGMHQAQVALSHQALHDDLTGLPNRVLFRDRLRQALVDGRRRGDLVAVGFVDLDLFKRINSSLGHQAGDSLLMQVGWRLAGQLRAGDTLGRFGGDEFVVVWRDLTTPAEAERLAQRLSDCLADSFEIGETAVTVSASIGVATSAGGAAAEELIQCADVAMYEAKRRGGSRVSTFAADLRQGAHARMATESDLRAALTGEQLVLHYQPVMDLRSGRAVGLEALVRWQHPTRGLLAPGDFIAIAEDSGLIVPLGRWTLDRACADAAALSGRSQGLHVAVNLSVRQLNDHDVVTHVRDALSKSHLEPHRLVLEVTESAIMQDEDLAALVLEELAQLGVRLAIDDFGTGFSSLLYLRRYPIDALKIDRAFVAALPKSSDDHAICSSVVSLAHAVRATSIAEGVETLAQYAALRGMGCELAQGFLWSRAVPLHELDEAIERSNQVPRQKGADAPVRPRSDGALEAPVLARMLELQASGASLHTISAALNSEGTRTPRGTRWTATGVARHLLV